jgi:hypothetical protein
MDTHLMDKKALNGALEEIDARLQASSLTEEEKNEARIRAREHVRAKRKEKAVDEAFKRAVTEEEREYEPNDQLVDIMIDLPKYAAFVRLDHVVYYHGLPYEVPMIKAQTILDIMARAWEHQSEIEGKRRKGDNALRPQNYRIGPQHEGMSMNKLDDLKQLARI